MNEMCRRCGELAAHRHHRKRRSQGGDNSEANLVPVCVPCHDWIHHNPLKAYEDGWLVKSWDDPAEVGFSALQNVEPHLHPGEKCPSCARRIPYPKKKDSPKSKVMSVRVPEDGIEEWNELFELIAERVGVSTKEPYFKYKALLYALREALA